MILDIKGRTKEKGIKIVGILLGICLGAVSLFYFFHAEKAEAEKRMVEIVNYVKVQCSTYTHYNESSESKSLLRAIESARQMSTNIDMEIENGGQLSRDFLKENLQTLWVDGIIVLDAEGKTDCEYSTDESLANEITEYLQKEIIMNFAGSEERSYSERFTREDGSHIDIAACARKDAPGIVAIYYYTSPEFARNYTLTIQGLLNGYSIQKDGTIIVADDGIVVASNNESLLGQNTAGNEVVQAMKKHTDSQHIYHFKKEGTGCYGIMLKQRDYYIYAYLPDTEVFHNLPLSVAGVIFLYFLIFSIFLFWGHRTNQAHQKQEQEKDEKYKAELLTAAKKAEAANEAKTEFLQRMSHDIRTPINGIYGLINMADHYADDMEKQKEYRTKVKAAANLLLELVNDVLDMGKLESGEVVQAMKKHTDSQHIYHLKNEGTGCYGIMLKQRDYYIYAYLPDTEVFHNLPLSVAGVIFLYFLMFSIFWFWTYRTNQAHQKQEQEKDEKYKSELLIAAKKAEAANEAKTEFLQRMSHDIRTPINGICGLVNMADHYADDTEKQTEYRTKVKEASNLLLELVNEILDMSKLESGEVVLEEIPFNLSSIFREVFIVIEQMAAEQNIRIMWEKKEITHRDLIGSPGYVKRVMMNILSNAVKYNRENGQIYISCMEIPSEQPEMTTMEFVCRDTGIGMTEEFQKCVFEPFAQEHTGSRAKFTGTGLGLSISRKLVEKMGGTITFESKKGVGTTFVIRVPFKIDPDADKREEQKDVSEKSIKGLHILLAEDNELNMEIAEFVLQNEGADVTKAWDGQEAVELFRNSEPGEFDVILMDIMMPVMNGYETTKMIRSLDREDAKAIPIIAMTANAFTEDRIRAKEAGMDEHVAKPVDVELLIKVIHKLVKYN